MDAIIAKGKADLAKRVMALSSKVTREKPTVGMYYKDDVVDTRKTSEKPKPQPPVSSCMSNDGDCTYSRKVKKPKTSKYEPSRIVPQTAPVVHSHTKNDGTPPVLIEVLSFKKYQNFNHPKNPFSSLQSTSSSSKSGPSSTSESSHEEVKALEDFLLDFKTTFGKDPTFAGFALPEDCSSEPVLTSSAPNMQPSTSESGKKTSGDYKTFIKGKCIAPNGRIAWDLVPAADLSLIESDSGAESDTPLVK